MRQGKWLLGIIILLSFFALTQQVEAKVGYVDFEFLFNAHPEYDSRNQELQGIAEELAADFQGEAENLESEEEARALAEGYEAKLEEAAEDLRAGIIASVREFIQEAAEQEGIEIVLPENMVIYGGINLTPRVVEMMYDRYGISVPSDLRQ